MRLVLLVTLLSALSICGVEDAWSQEQIGQKCSSTVLANALSTELLRSEAEELASISKSNPVLSVIRQGLKKVGAQAYYSGVAIGATAVCMGAEVPDIEIPSVYSLTEALMGDDDPCKNERKNLRDAKIFGASDCTEKDHLATLEGKYNAFKALLDARVAAFECIGDNDPTHADQIRDYEKKVNDCLKVMGK